MRRKIGDEINVRNSDEPEQRVLAHQKPCAEQNEHHRARVKPVSTMANPACMNQTRMAPIRNHTPDEVNIPSICSFRYALALKSCYSRRTSFLIKSDLIISPYRAIVKHLELFSFFAIFDIIYKKNE